ncbi:MAG: NAD-dependent epimerase/dehydratase family protein [Nocardioidaceae bacterium]
MKVVVAGATGAIGRYLIPRLIARGHHVTASTRRQDKLDGLRTLGAEPVVMDGLDRGAVAKVIERAEPEVIVHQMTALAGKANLRKFDTWFATTNQLRTTGTENLLAAAEAAGVQKLVAQSYTGWSNARTGGPVKSEDDPLDPAPAKNQEESMAGLRFLDQVVPSAPLQGIVLRYGNFYGPGASEEMVMLVRKRQLPVIGNGAGVWSWVHLDDAAAATVAAVERGSRGVYNVVDDEPAPVSEWLPHFADAVGAKPPLRVPVWLGRLAAGEVTVRWMTEARGSSNDRAKSELGWSPKWPMWRDGFRHALTD